MCVALQRWPHWVATWVSVRETALGYAKSMRIDAKSAVSLRQSIVQMIRIYERADPQVLDEVTSNETLIGDLERISALVSQTSRFSVWGEFADYVAEMVNEESAEQLNSLLLDLVPEVCDVLEPCFRIGAELQRRFDPAMTVTDLRDLLRRNYGWALRADRTLSETHQHFWYHSVDNGEQRRGERIIDPHEQFESFIDHVRTHSKAGGGSGQLQ